MKSIWFADYNWVESERWYIFEGHWADMYAWTHPIDAFNNRFYAISLTYAYRSNNGTCRIACKENDFIICTEQRFPYNAEMWDKLKALRKGGLSHRQILEFLEL